MRLTSNIAAFTACATLALATAGMTPAQALDIGLDLGVADVNANASIDNGLAAAVDVNAGGSNGINANVDANIGNGINAYATAAIGNGINADVGANVGNGINAAVNAGVGNRINANLGVGIGNGAAPGTPGTPGVNPGGQPLPSIVAGMSRSQIATYRKTCSGVTANPGAFDGQLVKLCRLIAAAR